MKRRAKIIATLGPASTEPGIVARLLAAGVDIVRLNLSHGDHAQHQLRIERVRAAAAERGVHVPILLDLMGPRYRLGTIADGPRPLKRGAQVVLGEEAAGVDVPLDNPELLAHFQTGERVLIDNGLIELEITGRRGRTVGARVITGGAISTRKGINLPDTELPFTVSAKDADDIAFAVAAGVDYLAASYVAGAADLEGIRAVVRRHGGAIPLVAKLERKAAIHHLHEIIDAADAVMVARGDLGVEVPLDKVPVLQKRIVVAGRATATPVIVATQMLESMMERPRPTRAEATDIANAVLEGADAVMLSGETAAGRYPVEAVRTMAKIIEEAERYRREHPEAVQVPKRSLAKASQASQPDLRYQIADVVCSGAARAADQLGASFIVAFSQGGFTARSLARYRPAAPIRVFTTTPEVARRLQLVWGVRPLVLDDPLSSLDQVVEVVERKLKSERLAKAGDTLILVMGDPIRERPLTNLMRIHRISA